MLACVQAGTPREFLDDDTMPKSDHRWMEASDVIPMFPTLVWQIQLVPELRDAVDASVVAVLTELRRGLPPLAQGQGWQSERALHERAELQELVACVKRGVTGALRFLHIGEQAFEITGCWATVLARGATHKPHSHPNNFLSGVYYVHTRPGADTINFHDPRRQTYVIRPPVTELTAENTDQVVIRVRDGTLLLFPSYLEHSVDANMSEQERISLSFNVMFSAFTQRVSKPLW
jgi:uncharacterized protein (TIGR02466 family)